MAQSDNSQFIVYWSTWASGLALILFSLFTKSLGFAIAGAFLFLVLLLSNPAFKLVGAVIAIVNGFIEKTGDKMLGKLSPDLTAAVASLNKAHENDKAFDARLSNIESSINALKLAKGFENRRTSQAVEEILG